MKKWICLLLLCGLLLPLFGAAIPSAMQAEAIDSATYPLENGADATELAFTGRTEVDPANCDTYVKGNTGWKTAFDAITVSNNTYEISTANQLLGFFYKLSQGTNFSGKTIKLAKDFDLTDFDGSIQVPNANQFRGTFNGQGHVIQGYKTVTEASSSSVFGTLNGAKIQKVSFIESTISGLAAESTGTTTINSVYVAGTVIGVDTFGGLVGVVSAGTITVQDSQVNVICKPSDSKATNTVAGGLLGSVTGSAHVKINACENNESVKAYSHVGGMIGSKSGTGTLEILNSTNSGKIIGTKKNVGGMVGHVTGSGQTNIQYCTNSGAVTAIEHIGGMVGQFENVSGNTSFIECINKGAITGDASETGGRIAGIVGEYIGLEGNTVLFNGCENQGAVKHEGDNTGGCWMGGIAGYVMGRTQTVNDKAVHEYLGSVTVQNCHNTGDLFANRSSGGLVGFVQRTKEFTMTGCTVDADLYFQIHSSSNRYVGGLIGILHMGYTPEPNLATATISNCNVSGTMTVSDPIIITIPTAQEQIYTAGGLVGLVRTTNLQAQNCKVDLEFAKELSEEDDVINMAVGSYLEPGNKGAVTPSNITYYWHNDDVAIVEDYVELADSRAYFKAIGHQYLQNKGKDGILNTSDDTYDLRYIFGVKNLKSGVDNAIGFELVAKTLGKEVTTKEKTVYCPKIYNNLNYTTASGKAESIRASEYKCDYFCTLVIAGVPADEVTLVPKGEDYAAYINNTILDFTPITVSGETDTNPHKGTGAISHTYAPKRHTFGQEDFTPYLPSSFEEAEGIVSSKNIVYPAVIEAGLNADGKMTYKLDPTSIPQNTDSVNLVWIGGGTNGNNQFVLQAKDSASNVGWSANGAIAYLVNTAEEGMPHHYYIDVETFNKKFDPDIDDLYEAYYSFDFEVEEAGYYDFCFRIRLNGSDGGRQTRAALVQFDDETYGEQSEFYYNIVVKDGTMRDNAQNHDSYLTGFNKYLTAGSHTITFRSSYALATPFHIRDIYMIKDAPEPVDADIPLPEGAVLYDGNFDNNVTYALDATTKAVFDAYRATLAPYGFELMEERVTDFQYSKFDTTYTQPYTDANGNSQSYTYEGNYTEENKDTVYHNYYYIYTNADYMLNVYFCDATGDMRVIVSDAEEYQRYAQVNAEADAYDGRAVTTPMFALLDIGGKDIVLEQGVNADKKITGVTNGMCLVYRLSDGRFIVVDGGFWNTSDTEGEGVARLYDWLCKHADYDNDMDYTNNKVTIAAWLITHHHSDHISVAWKFNQMYQASPMVEIENYLYNFPSYEYAMSIYGTNLSPSAYDTYYPQLHSMMSANNTLVAHTGMLYNFADCSIEILFTHEDFYPYQFKSYNNSNTVFKITLAGKTFLVAGDLEEPGQIDCIKQTGTLLEADFLQVTHHGANGQVEFYKYIVGLDDAGNFNTDTIVIWPLPKGENTSLFKENSRRGFANKWLADMFRKESDQANDNIHYAIENWEYYIFKLTVEEDDGGYSNIVPF